MKTKNLGDEFATFQDLFDTVVTRLAAGGNCRWVFDCIGVQSGFRPLSGIEGLPA